MNIHMGSDESIELQIQYAGERMRQAITCGNWEAVRVDAEHAGRLDAELRTRKNEHSQALRQRQAAIRNSQGYNASPTFKRSEVK